MRNSKKKKTLSEKIAIAWTDLRVKLIVIGTLFISSMAVVMIIVTDIQNDKMLLESKADKYETYIEQLLLKKFTKKELSQMSRDQIELSVDMVIQEDSNRLVDAPTISDFILPVKNSQYIPDYKLTREPKKSWSKEDIDLYWVDIETLDLDNLGKRNYDYLKARLSDIK